MSAGTQIIIGIDFGTTVRINIHIIYPDSNYFALLLMHFWTEPLSLHFSQYSGVSWALSTGNREVRIINDWPNPQGVVANQDKVPSAISYDANGKVAKWGYKVNVSDDSFRWFKILLDPLHKYFRETQHVQEVAARIGRMGKTPEDIVADYLKCIWDYSVEHLKRKKGDDFREVYTVKVVLTVPAVWSDMAKDRTLRAAVRAGIPVGSKLVTEPEAAALALLMQKSEENSMRVRYPVLPRGIVL